VEIRQILEDPKSSRTPEDAERAAAAQITALIASAPGDASLTARDPHGRTPLMQAASDGYPLVVTALLTAPGVKREINAVNASGETAWMLAQFAPSLTLAACQPGALTLDRAVLLPPYLRRMAHLLQPQGGAGTVDVVHALEKAGAEQSPEAAKKAWLARCPNATPELRQALAQGPLTATLINEAINRQLAFHKSAKDAFSVTPDKPPQDMRFIPAAVEAMPAADPTTCTKMPKPDLRGFLPLSGEVLFKAVVSTRAGVVEVVDLELASPGKSKGRLESKVVDHLRQMVLRALAGYQCEGEHVFAQEFQFNIR
jgi:hypothetical protein